MFIDLKALSQQKNTQCYQITLDNRLPTRIIGPILIDCEWSAIKFDDYFLLTLMIQSTLTIVCQRCLALFNHDYHNKSVIALCHTDKKAQTLMNDYECITIEQDQCYLPDLLIDELHLYAPEIHPNSHNCSAETTDYFLQKTVI